LQGSEIDFGPQTRKQAAVNIIGRFAVRASLTALATVIAMTCANAQATPPSSGAVGGATYYRVVLEEDDPAAPNTKQRKYEGRVQWRAEMEPGAQGPASRVIRADIDIPEANLSALLTFRLNNDAALPASHTVEIRFRAEPGFEGGDGIANAPGLMLKPSGPVRGTRLEAISVKVRDNHFLVGLEDTELARKTNLKLLSEQAWFDIPMIYADKRRAIIAVEKGATGELIFAAVLKEWGAAQRK
jgi:hypothetical protein